MCSQATSPFNQLLARLEGTRMSMYIYICVLASYVTIETASYLRYRQEKTSMYLYVCVFASIIDHLFSQLLHYLLDNKPCFWCPLKNSSCIICVSTLSPSKKSTLFHIRTLSTAKWSVLPKLHLEASISFSRWASIHALSASAASLPCYATLALPNNEVEHCNESSR